tara:strand:+ start:684 stop:1259 length:576 start_codon:yes stop_codon:yes gene_type:complete
MNNSFANYEDKLELILSDIKNKNRLLKNNLKKDTHNEEPEEPEEKKIDTKDEEPEEKKTDTKPVEKDYYCKQLDSLNYCLEMHKVRKNKKADFDIHSAQKYNIEDEDIDKPNIVLGWKDLSDIKKEELIENFIVEITDRFNLDLKQTMEFVNSNISKIKYDKQKEKIVDILGMTTCIENNTKILKIKKKKY